MATMTLHDLLVELERRAEDIRKTAETLPIEPYFVAGYRRAVADIRQILNEK